MVVNLHIGTVAFPSQHTHTHTLKIKTHTHTGYISMSTCEAKILPESLD